MIRISTLLLLAVFMVVLSEAQPDQDTNLIENESLSREVREPRRNVQGKRSSKKRQLKKRKCKGKKCRRGNKRPSRRNNKKGSRKSGKKCARQSGPDDSTCMANIGTAMDYQGNQIKNFGKQKAKIEKFEKLMNNKGGKKDDFSNSTTYMTSACSSSSTNASAVSTITLLQNCSASINEGCQVPMVNTTMLESCKTSFDAVETKNKECYGLLTAATPDLSAACTCYAAAAKLVEETKALSCSAKATFDMIKASKSTCLSKFSACKKAEDDSIGLIHVCNGNTTPSPMTTMASNTTTAAAGSPTTGAPAPTTAGAKWARMSWS